MTDPTKLTDDELEALIDGLTDELDEAKEEIHRIDDQHTRTEADMDRVDALSDRIDEIEAELRKAIGCIGGLRYATLEGPAWAPRTTTS